MWHCAPWLIRRCWDTLNLLRKSRMKVLMKSRFFRFIMIFRDSWKYAGLSYIGPQSWEKLGVLKVGFEHATDRILAFFAARCGEKCHIDEVVQQSVKKKSYLLSSAVFGQNWLKKGGRRAINSFLDNLRNLLLVAPLKGRVVLGFDPAFRTGAKLSCRGCNRKMLDNTGHLSC